MSAEQVALAAVMAPIVMTDKPNHMNPARMMP
jgi:hypothetical protein